ncbi:hypothetical protein C8R46DRAFT_1042107 [Mycena filopes]|nr:hypothetical protein C8R46DRAFT_1042107 [Mycena filopes]
MDPALGSQRLTLVAGPSFAAACTRAGTEQQASGPGSGVQGLDIGVRWIRTLGNELFRSREGGNICGGREGRYHRESCPRAREQGSGEYIDEILTEVRDERVPKEAAGCLVQRLSTYSLRHPENGDLLYTQTHPWSLPRPPAVTGSHLSTRISIDEYLLMVDALVSTTWHRSVVSSPEAAQVMELDMPARTAYGPRRVLQGLAGMLRYPRSFALFWQSSQRSVWLIASAALTSSASTLPITPGDGVAGASSAVGGNGGGDGGTSPASGSAHRAADPLPPLAAADFDSSAANDKTTRLPLAPAACRSSRASWTHARTTYGPQRVLQGCQYAPPLLSFNTLILTPYSSKPRLMRNDRSDGLPLLYSMVVVAIAFVRVGRAHIGLNEASPVVASATPPSAPARIEFARGRLTPPVPGYRLSQSYTRLAGATGP